jgi:hypothetical protein
MKGKKMSVDPAPPSPPPDTSPSPPPPATTTDASKPVRVADNGPVRPGSHGKGPRPQPAAPELHRAPAKPDGAKLQRDAEEAVKHYSDDKVEYQSKLRELGASNDTPETKQDRAINAYLLVSHSWKNAQRAATAYLEFV